MKRSWESECLGDLWCCRCYLDSATDVGQNHQSVRTGRGTALRASGWLAEPGLNFIIPFIDHMTKVSLRVLPAVVEPQEGITWGNVTVKMDAAAHLMVIDPIKSVINVENHKQAVIQLALTTLRSVLGQSERDESLAYRAHINLILRQIMDAQSEALADAARVIQSQPSPLRLRYLQTRVKMAGEHNSTIIPLTTDVLGALGS